MASRTQPGPAAPWILTALVMLGAGVVVFYGADLLKQQQAQTQSAEHARIEALHQVDLLGVQVTALTTTLKQIAAERDAAAAKLLALQTALNETQTALEKLQASAPGRSK